MSQNITYSALKSNPSAVKPKHRKREFAKGVGTLVLVGIIFFVGIPLAFMLLASLPSVYIAFVLLPLVIIAIAKYRDKGKKDAFMLFAEQNGWHYGLTGELYESFNPAVVQQVRQQGHDIISVQGTADMGRFELVLGVRQKGTKHLEEPLSLTLVVEGKVALPEAVLVSRDITQGTALFDNLYIKFKDPQKVSLEGNFDTDLQLYIPQGTQVDALAVISPDVMAVAKTFVQRFTIQMSGQHVAFMPASGDASAETIRQLFEAAQQFMSVTTR